MAAERLSRISNRLSTASSEMGISGNRWSWHQMPEPAITRRSYYGGDVAPSQTALTATPSFPDSIELTGAPPNDAIDEEEENELHTAHQLHSMNNLHRTKFAHHGSAFQIDRQFSRHRDSMGLAQAQSRDMETIDVAMQESSQPESPLEKKPPPVRDIHGWKWGVAGKDAHTQHCYDCKENG